MFYILHGYDWNVIMHWFIIFCHYALAPNMAHFFAEIVETLVHQASDALLLRN